MLSEEKIISYTANPYKELLEVASRTDIELAKLDFTLLAFSSWYRFGDAQWEKISEKDLIIFENDEEFLKNNLQIKQEYKIEIFQINEPNVIANCIQLVANKNLTKIVAQIDTKNLVYHDKLALELMQNIYKKMLKLKFLIGIRTFNFKKQLLFLANKVKDKSIKQAVKIVVAKGIDPSPTQDEKLVLVYKDKATNFTLDEQRSGIIAVEENELVLKHIKAKDGTNGRDLKLHFLKVLKAVEHKLKVSCSDAFRIEENEEAIEYFAAKKGFVVENADKFDIANVLDFSNMKFKNIGVIKAGLNNDVTINVKTLSEMEEAVNSGIGIECYDLNITGNVAGNTRLSATNLNINGTTHTRCKIEAKQAYIKVHRGYIEGEDINIDLLENGNVKGKVVKIKKSLGGTIEADKLYIEELVNHNTSIFYENAVVGKFSGENNKFNVKIKNSENNHEEEFFKIKNKLSKLALKIKTLKKIINSNKNGIVIIEKKVEELKNANKNIPEQYQKIIRKFKLYTQELIKIQNQEQELLLKQEDINKELLKAQDELFKAKMINKSGKWSDMNEIRFYINIPKQELFYSPSTQEETKLIQLHKQIVENQEHIEIQKKPDYEEKDLEWLLPSKE